MPISFCPPRFLRRTEAKNLPDAILQSNVPHQSSVAQPGQRYQLDTVMSARPQGGQRTIQSHGESALYHGYAAPEVHSEQTRPVSSKKHLFKRISGTRIKNRTGKIWNGIVAVPGTVKLLLRLHSNDEDPLGIWGGGDWDDYYRDHPGSEADAWLENSRNSEN